ncbi:MAG: site-specific integrase [Ktedonobacteraceae bacterium]
MASRGRRRGHNEGSIYQRKDGRWAASISLEGRKRKTFYGKTRKEVQEQLKVALRDQQQGTLATGNRQTVGQFLEYWLEEVHKEAIRLSSYVKYRALLDRYVFPAFRNVQLQKLTQQQVQALYSRKSKEGLAPETVRGIHRMLHKALDDAVLWGQVPRNVSDSVTLPRLARNEIKPLNREQARQLLDAAHEHRMEALLTVALATGMRRGEILGLHWKDIDFENRSVQVRHTVDRIGKFGIMESEPKTSSSRRKILLPDFVIESLKEHRTRQTEARLKVGEAWQENDLVFCNIYGGFWDPANLLTSFGKLLKDAGLPHMRFHDLRHSTATILLTMGVHPKVVQELLGHTNISLTMDTYSHVLPSMQRDAMDDLDDFFGE